MYLVKLRHVSVLLDFEKVAVAEQLSIPARGSSRFVVASVGQDARDFGGGAAGQANEAGAEFLQQFLINARAVVEALNMALGDQLHEVAIAGVVARQ